LVLVHLAKVSNSKLVLMVVLHYCHILTLIPIKLDLVEVVVDMVPITPDLKVVRMVDQVVVAVKDQQPVLVQQIHLLE
tara:strand:- start:358 stop:591 length:234 start_codon:yes stop_codon:yes gene_type:complete